MTNREHFDAYDRASEITRAIPSGAFMTTRSGDKVNSMVIGWGTIGNIWGRPVFIATSGRAGSPASSSTPTQNSP